MAGLPIPESNYFKVPNVFWDLDLSAVQRIVLLYIIRHTWGYHEYGLTKRITIAEFQNGRKLSSGLLMDKGTGLSRGAISEALRSLESMGLIEVETDDADKARVKKSYALVIQRSPDEHGVHLMNTEFTQRTRSEKDTKERHLKKDNDSPSLSDIAKAYEKNIGALTAMISDSLKDLVNDYPTEWIIDAFKIAVESEKRSIRYVQGVLVNWKREGRTLKSVANTNGETTPTESLVVTDEMIEDFKWWEVNDAN